MVLLFVREITFEPGIFPAFRLTVEVQDVQGSSWGHIEVAVLAVLFRLPVSFVHPPAFGLSNRSPLMPSTLSGKSGAKLGLLTGNQRTLKPQFPLVVLDYLRSCSDCKMVEFISQKLMSNVQLGSDCDITLKLKMLPMFHC